MTIQTDAFPELDRVKKFFPLGVENTQLLTKAQIDQYNDQGYLFPFDIFSAEEITEIRAYFFDDLLPKAMAAGWNSYEITNWHKHCRSVYDLVTNSRILDYVQDLLGEKRKVIYRLDPETAPAVKMAFELYLAGRGGKHIADVLTSHGFRSRNDKPISKSSILNWFRVPFVYAGCRVWNVSHWQKNDAGKKVNRIFHPREEWVIIPDSHPAIIKMEDAEQAYQNMQKNNPNNHQRRMGQRAKYLLAGLANCDHCGHNLQMKYNRRNGEAYYCCGYRRLSQANCDNRRHYNQDLIEDTVMEMMEMMDEFLLQEGYIENQLHQQLEQVEKQRQESKAEIEQLTAEKQEIEARIDTSLELLVDGRVPKERVIIKMQQDEQRLRDLQDKIIKQEEIKAPTAEDLEVFRNQLRSKVEGELDIDTKKSVLNSLIKKLKVDQDGLVEIDFCVALGHTPYTSYLLRGFQ